MANVAYTNHYAEHYGNARLIDRTAPRQFAEGDGKVCSDTSTLISTTSIYNFDDVRIITVNLWWRVYLFMGRVLMQVDGEECIDSPGRHRLKACPSNCCISV